MSGEGRGNAVTQLGQITCSSEAIILCGGLFLLQHRLEWITPTCSQTLVRHSTLIKCWILQALAIYKLVVPELFDCLLKEPFYSCFYFMI